MGMAVTRTKAEEFRRLAQECRATAQTLSTEQARAEMLAMADVCDRVVAQQTHGTDLSEAGAPVGLGGCHSRILGSMDGNTGPLRRRHSGKGRAVPVR
jgi:hypothetical protein